jgi:predicted phage terminase large subunit-like protein
MSGIPKSIRCTLNPDPNSFIYEWVRAYLDDDDFPIKELSGKTRYFVVVEGDLFTSWDEEELRVTHGKDPETYTYIPATLDDNVALDTLDISYRKKLDSMPEAKRKALLFGCWSMTEDNGIFFKREYLKKAHAVPADLFVARGYDLAATAGDTPSTKGCDRTASILMGKSKDGYYYIMSGTAYRKNIGERDNTILQQCKHDGDDIHVVVPKDTGAGGKAAYTYLANKLSSEGFICKSDPAPSTASKLKRATPFFTACENGLVFIIEQGFDPDVLKLFYTEGEAFDGVSRSTSTRHDDMVDAAASVFNYLNTTKRYETPNISALATQPSLTMKALADIYND